MPRCAHCSCWFLLSAERPPDLHEGMNVVTCLQASEMLLFNKKLTAAQACSLGLVTEVFPDSSFQSEVWSRLKAYAQLPRKVSTSRLTRAHSPVHSLQNHA